MSRHGSWGRAALALAALGAGCVPDIAHDPPPVSMEFDPAAVPPRVPQPIGLVINPTTGKIDFSLAGPAVPADCTAPAPYSQAECEFDTYLQTLDGFPTVTPAQAPVTGALDLGTLAQGTNVVVVAARAGTVLTDLIPSSDAQRSLLDLHPSPHWSLGEVYWIGVRGYSNGVRATDGKEVVGSPVIALLKQTSALDCGHPDAESLSQDPNCPAFALLRQGQPTDQATQLQIATTLGQLELIRKAYGAPDAGWDLMAKHGLPKEETAVLWSFPIHTATVAEVDPTVGLVPRLTSPTQFRIAVQGPVDPATVKAFTIGATKGTTSVLLVNLTELALMHVGTGLPHVTASYDSGGGDIVIDADAPFIVGDLYGVFLRKEMHDDKGNSLVPSPISVLLTLKGALVDGAMHSTISTVGDGDAATLDIGRQQLAALFAPAPQGTANALTGDFLTPADLVYAYAFQLGSAP